MCSRLNLERENLVMTIIFAPSFCSYYALCLPCVMRQDVYIQYLNKVAFFCLFVLGLILGYMHVIRVKL